MLEIDISVKSSLWDSVPDVESLARMTVERAVTLGYLAVGKYDPVDTEISIVLADNAMVQELNKTYRHKDKPTNVLSFPQTELEGFDSELSFISLGDVIVAYETLLAESQEQGKSFSDHFRHLLVHGTLHLMHFDHETESEAEEMESLEIEILRTMSIKNPYEML